MADCDGIVIGAGHNGLTTAAYLSRAGLKVAVLERNGRIGGGTSTEDRILPGHRLNLHANFFMGWEFCPLVKDLDLVRYGYSYIEPPVQQAVTGNRLERRCRCFMVVHWFPLDSAGRR